MKRFTSACAALLSLAAASADQPCFTTMDLPRAIATDVTGDGSVVVGYYFMDGVSRSFRWEVGVTTELGGVGRNHSSEAYGVSDDGLTIVGRGYTIDLGALLARRSMVDTSWRTWHDRDSARCFRRMET